MHPSPTWDPRKNMQWGTGLMLNYINKLGLSCAKLRLNWASITRDNLKIVLALSDCFNARLADFHLLKLHIIKSSSVEVVFHISKF